MAEVVAASAARGAGVLVRWVRTEVDVDGPHRADQRVAGRAVGPVELSGCVFEAQHGAGDAAPVGDGKDQYDAGRSEALVKNTFLGPESLTISGRAQQLADDLGDGYTVKMYVGDAPDRYEIRIARDSEQESLDSRDSARDG